ncbi:40S ribosomal protein mrp10 [Cryomyces antarcticus]|nr:40S ribosomal protein mrp10 [Cryomyces antarcticus]
MPPKPGAATTTAIAAPRLPPLPKLRVRRPNKSDANPCLGIMSSVLETENAEEEHDQLPSLPNVSQDHRATQAEIEELAGEVWDTALNE